MAKAAASKTEENGTPAPEATTATEKKAPKIERLFQSTGGLNDLRKAENRVNWQFNRMFAQIKKMEISKENQEKILEILKAEHAVKAKAVLDNFSKAPAAPAGDFV